MCVDLSLGFLFCSIDLYVCLCASTWVSIFRSDHILERKYYLLMFWDWVGDVGDRGLSS